MAKKTYIAMERHIELGNRLIALKEEMLKLSIELREVYPKFSRNSVNSKKIQNSISKINIEIGVLRNHLENLMYIEHPQEANLHVYYGQREE